MGTAMTRKHETDGSIAATAATPAFYTAVECAQALSCSQSYVRVLIARGILPSVRIGGLLRVPVDAIAQLASQCMVSGQE